MQHTLNKHVEKLLRTNGGFGKNKQKLAAIAHPGPRGGKSRQKPSKMSEICLPTRSKSALAEAKVDKD